MPESNPTININSDEIIISTELPQESTVIIGEITVPVSISEGSSVVNINSTEETGITISPSENSITINENGIVQIVELGVRGPQGPYGSPSRLDLLEDVDTSGKIDKSILVYNASQGKFIVDQNNTTQTIADGGNF